LLKKTKSLGASVAGVASTDALKASPSHLIYPKIGMNLGVGARDSEDAVSPGQVAWPTDGVSAVVIGVEHKAK